MDDDECYGFASGDDIENDADYDAEYEFADDESFSVEPVRVSPGQSRTFSRRGSVPRDISKRRKSDDPEEIDTSVALGDHFQTRTARGDVVYYEVLMPQQVVAKMDKIIGRAREVMEEVPPSTIRLMLGQLKWDTERLLTRYYENPEKLFTDLRVGTVKPRALSVNRVIACDICLLDTKSTDLKAADCGHYFCADCWSSYLTVKILGDISASRMECPSNKCKTYLDDAFVMSLLSADSVRLRYQYCMTSSFVDFHPCMRRCPGTDCLRVACVQERSWIPICCEPCDLTFCFLCGNEWHDPIKCDWLKKWQKKCMDDSETCNWLSVNTKDCPECKSAIEKNGGCNHMTCRKCRHEFCWICFAKWPHPGGMSCNSYKNSENEGPRKALERYLFFFKRFDNHEKSVKLERKLKEKLATSMESFRMRYTCGWIELQFLVKAVDVLKRCRQTLMYTYAFAYYLKEGNEKDFAASLSGELI
ncbi:E3 ubiquitin-protein ligase arih1-like [Paramacrobiotus metropolitanus]|uniref:E3 ubiquitin-protein ligase arih1-like n=1 Tax=Paramacrobiotus metropolitanus TaxID=2943436 RepID=UPI002445C8F2|nr:E3 ubiquitin-protein ligase arih1-like [Paramacrobiotus metropolitanus]